MLNEYLPNLTKLLSSSQMHGTYLKTMILCNVSFAMVMMTLNRICQICYHIVIILLSMTTVLKTWILVFWIKVLLFWGDATKWYHYVYSPKNGHSCLLDKGFAVLRGCNKMNHYVYSPKNGHSCFLDKGFAVLRGCNKMISLCL